MTCTFPPRPAANGEHARRRPQRRQPASNDGSFYQHHRGSHHTEGVPAWMPDSAGVLYCAFEWALASQV